MKRLNLKYMFLVLTVVALCVWGAAVTIPNSFSPGDDLSSAKMNENFSALATAVTSLETTEPGIEFAKLPASSNLSTTIKNLGSITLTPPADGFVMVTHEGVAVFFGDNTTLQFGLGTSGSSNDLYEGFIGRLDGTATIRYEYSYSSRAVIPVEANNDITLFANAQKSTVFDTNQINLTESVLVATFFANRY